jgi:hypothetical protein
MFEGTPHPPFFAVPGAVKVTPAEALRGLLTVASLSLPARGFWYRTAAVVTLQMEQQHRPNTVRRRGRGTSAVMCAMGRVARTLKLLQGCRCYFFFACLLR